MCVTCHVAGFDVFCPLVSPLKKENKVRGKVVQGLNFVHLYHCIITSGSCSVFGR